MKTFAFAGHTYKLLITTYRGNKRLAVAVIDIANSDAFCLLSVNAPWVVLKEGEFLVQENDLSEACKHLFVDTGRKLKINARTEVCVWTLRHPNKYVVFSVDKAIGIFDESHLALAWMKQQQMSCPNVDFRMEEVPYF